MSALSPSEHVKSLLNKYPLVGVFRGPRRPHDALWLPPGWKSASYPRETSDSDNARAIIQWLEFEAERLAYQAQQSGDYQERYPNETEACEYNETAVIADAYSLVAYLQKKNKWANPPPKPGRKYTRRPEDLDTAIEELAKVRDWIETQPTSGEGVTLFDHRGRRQGRNRAGQAVPRLGKD